MNRTTLLCVFVLAACDGAPAPPADGGDRPRDAGLDATVTPPDAGPPCDDFTGSYRTAMLVDPCLRGTVVRTGVLCVAQRACDATIFGTHGQTTGTASGGALSFELDGLACTARLEAGGLTITCADPVAMTSCDSSAVAAPAVAGACCLSDTECAAGDRCAAITHPPTSPIQVVSACVTTGAGTLGSACRTEGGVDDCGAGLTCTGGPLGESAIECRTLCRAATDCAAGEACVWYSLTAPPVGFCIPSCMLYGDECGASGTCDGITGLDADGALSDALACRAVGTVPPRAACMHDGDCTANHTCARPPGGAELRCHPICGPSNPCESAADRCVLIGVSSSPPSGACFPR